MPGRIATLILGVAALLLANPSSYSRVVNGASTSNYPATVALISPSSGDLLCTATLIACDVALTAAHCVCNESNGRPGCQRPLLPGNLQIYLQDDQTRAVASIAISGEYIFGGRADLALVGLDAPASGIAPARLSFAVRPLPGTPATLIGFGRTLQSSRDAGVKRQGEVTLTDCSGSSAADAEHLCWNFSADPLLLPSSDVNSCTGDSGAAVFVDDDIVAVVSGGNGACDQTDVAFNTAIDRNIEWITQTTEQLTSGCPIDAQATALTRLASITETLNNQNEYRTAIALTGATRELRVALNGETANNNDLDLAIQNDHPPRDLTDSICLSASPGVFESCVIEQPTVGIWHILVTRESGSEIQFQTTVNALSDMRVNEIFSGGFESR